MCGKASVSDLSWSDIYAFASTLSRPQTLPADPESRINISPSRLRRKAEPDSMVWESLPVIYADEICDRPTAALWPYIPPYSEGRLPTNKQGRLISTANARLRTEGSPFAPTFMGSWRAEFRVLARWTQLPDGTKHVTVAVITVEPNEVLRSVGHHRSPAILRDEKEAGNWLRANRQDALQLLRPYPNQTMGVEAVPMGIKIPGNQAVDIPAAVTRK